MMVFTGQSHQAALLSHNLSAGPTQYDSLLMVSRIGVEESCLIVTLETEAAGQPLSLTLYTEKGRQVLPMNKAAPITRQTFLAAAFVIVESLLHDRLQLPVMPQGKPVALEKPLREFYPDAGQRLKMHYFFSHRWLPAYAKSDPECFFGYFRRGEQEPTKFIQARWQMMEQELKLIPTPPPGQMVIRRVSDLQMRVEFPSVSQTTGEGGGRSADGASSYPVAIIQMPAPEFMTHAYYVGVVLIQGERSGVEPAKGEARAFTLEKIEQNPTDGRLCEWTLAEQEITHRNYGTQVAATRQEFIKAVLSKIEEPARLPAGSVSFNIRARP